MLLYKKLLLMTFGTTLVANVFILRVKLMVTTDDLQIPRNLSYDHCMMHR